VARYSTYGMAGIGITAGIGFVFALTILNTSVPPDTPQDENPQLQRGVETQPNAPSPFFIEQETPAAGQQGQDRAALSKEQSADDSQQGEMAMLQQEPAADLQPTLSLLTAVNGTSGQVMGEVESGMAFALGKPVFVRAHFINPAASEIIDHTIVLGLARNGSEDASQQSDNPALSYERAANFRGDIGASGNVELELYWNPDREGEYTLFVLSLRPGSFSDLEELEPLLSIAVRATDEG
jgi:hypothetical protein